MRIAICEDDKEMLKRISELVNKNFKAGKEEFELETFISGDKLLNSHKNKQFDVLFLDIILPDINGFKIAKKVREISDKTFIIFITTQDSMVYSSFDFTPFDFIPKISDDYVETKIARVTRRLLRRIKQNETITLTLSGGDKKSLAIKDIIYIESNAHHLNYYVKEDVKFTVRESMAKIDERLSKYDFIRIHNRVLVNMRKITRVDFQNNDVITNIKVLKISRRRKKNTEAAYEEFLRMN